MQGGMGEPGGRVSPEKRARKPWVRELMTSISCRDTVCTTSLRFWSSPSGHCTNLVCEVGTGTGGRNEGGEGHGEWPPRLCLRETGAPWKGAGNPYGVTLGPQGQEVVEVRQSRALKNMGVPGELRNHKHSVKLRGPHCPGRCGEELEVSATQG